MKIFVIFFFVFCLFPINSLAEKSSEDKDLLPKGNCELPKPYTDLSHCDFSGKKITDPDLIPEFDVPLSTEEKINRILDQLTLQEKVNFLGGELSNESVPGKGASFSFDFPI